MTTTGLNVWTYGGMLAVLWLISIAMEGRIMFRTTLALLLNWTAHVVWFYAYPDPSPYKFSIVVDLLTAVIILTRPAGRMQSVIGSTLLIQIGVGCGYWWHMLVDGYNPTAEQSYWAWLDWIALIQIALVGVAFGDGMAKRILGDGYRRLVPWHHEIPGSPHHPDLA